MKPQLELLQDYPFQRLTALKQGLVPPSAKTPIALSIGEPKHTAPEFVFEVLRSNEALYGRYPSTKGLPELRNAIANWLDHRFQLQRATVNPEKNVLPLTGTREGLFSIAQCLIDSSKKPLVMMPNPFYQIYEGAALLAGAEPFFMNADQHNGFLPELDVITEPQWDRCQLIYICSPGNPSGAVCDINYLKRLIELSEAHNFTIVSDECYSEIYRDQPPPGLLQACEAIGNHDFSRCLVMNSLSKRSNLAGLRSGFVAGDANILERFLLYRTYHGSTQSVPSQLASAAAWGDEQHVLANRAAYNRKFAVCQKELQDVWPQTVPEGGFFFWAETPIPSEEFAARLYADEHLTVLPGRYLSRDTENGNPGSHRVRMALVAEQQECIDAMQRITRFLQKL